MRYVVAYKDGSSIKIDNREEVLVHINKNKDIVSNIIEISNRGTIQIYRVKDYIGKVV